MGKGSRQRTLNTDRFNDNYDRIFGVKNESDKRVPQDKEEECRSKSEPTEEKE